MRRFALLATSALIITMLTPPTLAQQAPPERQRTILREQGEQPHLITIDFKGGTLEDMVAALKAASPDRPVNILYSVEAANIPVPPFEVSSADLRSTLQSLAYTSAGSPTTLSAGRTVRWDINSVGDGVYAVTLDNSPQYISTPRGQMLVGQSDRSTAVHSIAELIAGPGALSADDVLSALQAALAMEEGDEVKLAYHEGTGLVFARVTREQAGVIESTILNLRVSRESRQERELRDPLQSTLEFVGATDVNDLIAKVNRADNLRNQVLQLQRINADQQNRIIELQNQVAELKNFITALESKLKDN
ncbi:MAG: hypothetical protein ACIAQU_02920 [Phycisphaerales bacterium JB064]